MLYLDNISKKYKDKIVLNNLSYKFNETGLYFINGSSGSGKSTLLNIIGDLEKPTSGVVTKNNSVAFVFQESNLLLDLSVIDNIKMIGTKEIFEIEEILNDLNLSSIKDTPVRLLSGGEKQRLAIARAMVMNCEIVLMDEPTGNLDPDNSKNILDRIKKLSKTKLLIVVSHNHILANEYADVILEIRDKNLYEKENRIKEETKNDALVESSEKNNIFPFSYQLKYAICFIKNKKGKFIFSILLTFLSLLLLFLVLNISFFNVKDALVSGISASKNDYLTVQKDYFNENIKENIPVKKGEVFYNELSNATNEKINSYVNVIFPIADKNTKKNKINLIIKEDYNKEGLVITDFLSNYLFGTEKVINKQVQFKINNITLELPITSVLSTNYTKSEYTSFMTNTKYVESNIDLLLYKYSVCYVDKNVLLTKIQEEPSIELKASNFTSSLDNTASYTNPINTLTYIKDLSNELQDNQAMVSSKFYEWFMPDVNLPKNYEFKDLKQSINYNSYLEYMNMYDVYSTIKVIGKYSSEENGVKVSSNYFNKLVKLNLDYLIDGYCVEKPSEARQLVDKFSQEKITFTNVNLSPCYGVNDILKYVVKDIMLVAGAIVLLLSIIAIHTSISNFIEQKNKEIGILKSLKVKRRRIYNIFVIYSSLVSAIAYILSLIFGNVCLFLLNNYSKSSDIYNINYNLFNFNFFSYIILIGLILISVFITLIRPIIKITKIDATILVKEGV